MSSSNRSGCSSLRYFCIPADSNWKIPTIRPSQKSLNVFSSSRGMWSMSISLWNRCFTFSNPSRMILSVLSPKKSILIRPVDSITLPSYWVINTFSPFSSKEVEIGITSLISYFPMITPHAWTPILRILPSNFCAYLKVSCIWVLLPTCSFFSSGTTRVDSSIVTLPFAFS